MGSATWTATARWRAAGTVDEARLAKLLEHPYLTKPYPKSLDRFDFTAAMADGLDAEDGAATLTAFTAAAVGKALDLLPHRPKRLVVCGGGRHNPTIMAMLASRAGVEAVPAETLGWRGDAIEAECFAFLAVRVLRGLPISFPEHHRRAAADARRTARGLEPASSAGRCGCGRWESPAARRRQVALRAHRPCARPD